MLASSDYNYASHVGSTCIPHRNARKWLKNRIEQEPINLQESFLPVVINNVFPDNFYTEMMRCLLPTDFYQTPKQHHLWAKETLNKTGVHANSYNFWLRHMDRRRQYEEFSHHDLYNKIDFWYELKSWLCSSEMVSFLTQKYVGHMYSLEERKHFKARLRLVRETGAAYVDPYACQKKKYPISIIFHLTKNQLNDSRGIALYEEMGTKESNDNGIKLISEAMFTPNSCVVIPWTDSYCYGVEPHTLPLDRDTLELFLYHEN